MVSQSAKATIIEHSARGTHQLLVWMGAQHHVHLFVDEVLHRLDLVIKDALKFSAASVSVDLSHDNIVFLVDIPCDDNSGILDTGFWIIHTGRQLRNQQCVFGYIVAFGAKVTLVAQEAVAHHTIDDILQIAIDVSFHAFQTALEQLLRFEVDYSRSYCTAFGVAQGFKLH